jgi:hypothetical protein
MSQEQQQWQLSMSGLRMQALRLSGSSLPGHVETCWAGDDVFRPWMCRMSTCRCSPQAAQGVFM